MLLSKHFTHVLDTTEILLRLADIVTPPASEDSDVDKTRVPACSSSFGNSVLGVCALVCVRARERVWDRERVSVIDWFYQKQS